jgi:hypothetical protein
MRSWFFGLALVAGCTPQFPCDDCNGGEGPGPCEASESQAWDGESFDLSLCPSFEPFLGSPCANDSCITNGNEEALASLVRDIADQRGYADEMELVDVGFDSNGFWNVAMLYTVDEFRCTDEIGSEENGLDRETLEIFMPDAGFLPESVPSYAELDALMRECSAEVFMNPCVGACHYVEGDVPSDRQEGCARVTLPLVPPGELSCILQD